MQKNPALYVRSPSRRYEVADAEQVLDAARQIVDARMQRGMSFADPSVACALFRDKLATLEREVFATAMLDT